MQSLLTRLLLGGGGGFSPAALFSSGAEGVWYDPSDTSTLFQNGTTPVTAVEQPVGLMLDKSKGLVLGPELVTNGDFSNGATGWTSSVTGANVITISSGSVRFQTTGADTATLTQPNVVTPGKWYQVEFDVLAGSSGTLKVTPIGNVAAEVLFSCTPGRKKIISNVVSGTALVFSRVVANVADAYIDNISVRELPGNHAISYNSTTARPTLSARVNLLTYSEQFDNVVWGKPNYISVLPVSHANPIGGSISYLAIPNTALSAKTIDRTDSLPAYNTKRIYAKAAGYRYLQLNYGSAYSTSYANFDLQTGTVTAQVGGAASITDAGNGWWLLSFVVTGPVLTIAHGYTIVQSPTSVRGESMTGDGTSGIYIWGASVVPADQASLPYQRVNTATDYDTNGFPKYLSFDGSDDGMSTPANLDLTSTDKVTVFSGVRKLSDAAAAVLTELSALIASNNGAFAILGPSSAAGNNLRFVSKGTIVAESNATAVSPISGVITGVGDISGDVCQFRFNGSVTQTTTTDQGTGDYGSYPLYIGARNNASGWFNGYLYGLTVVGAQLTTPQIESMESWTAQRTGITL